MTHSGNITEQIEGIRQKTIAVLDGLIANAAEFELADPPGRPRALPPEGKGDSLIRR
jgi:hypothetical protein